MGEGRRKPRSGKARVAMLLLTGAVVGSMLAGPVASAAGGFGPVWKFVKSRLSAPGTINADRNPVDWSRLKNVPDGFADGVDELGGVGTIAIREDSVQIPGGVAQNGAYAVASVTRYCGDGERALFANAYYDGDLNGASVGGDNDQELTIASLRFVTQGNGDEGYTVWGGNDSGTDHTLTLQVHCLLAEV